MRYIICLFVSIVLGVVTAAPVPGRNDVVGWNRYLKPDEPRPAFDPPNIGRSSLDNKFLFQHLDLNPEEVHFINAGLDLTHIEWVSVLAILLIPLMTPIKSCCT